MFRRDAVELSFQILLSSGESDRVDRSFILDMGAGAYLNVSCIQAYGN